MTGTERGRPLNACVLPHVNTVSAKLLQNHPTPKLTLHLLHLTLWTDSPAQTWASTQAQLSRHTAPDFTAPLSTHVHPGCRPPHSPRSRHPAGLPTTDT